MFNLNEKSDDICNKYINEYKKDVNKNKQKLQYELSTQVANNIVLSKKALKYLEQKADDYNVMDLEFLHIMIQFTHINAKYQESIKELIENNC